MSLISFAVLAPFEFVLMYGTTVGICRTLVHTSHVTPLSNVPVLHGPVVWTMTSSQRTPSPRFYSLVTLVIGRTSISHSRPMLREDDSGSYSRGSLDVEVLIERDTIPTSTVSQVASAPSLCSQQQSLGLPQPTAAGRATVTGTVHDKGDDSKKSDGTRVAHEGMEAGGVVEEGWRQDETLENRRTEEMFCTLVDTTTGQHFPLDAAGSVPNWQLGLPPGDARRAGRRQNRSCCGAANESDIRVCLDCWRGDDVGVHGAARGAGIKRQKMMTATSARLFRLDRLPGEVRVWSAEDPQLYTLVVELRIRTVREEQDGDVETGTFSQFESARVGFRSVLVHSGQLLVNGRAVMFAGVNRHEHDPDTGKTVSEASMRRDIITMKRRVCRQLQWCGRACQNVLILFPSDCVRCAQSSTR